MAGRGPAARRRRRRRVVGSRTGSCSDTGLCNPSDCDIGLGHLVNLRPLADRIVSRRRDKPQPRSAPQGGPASLFQQNDRIPAPCCWNRAAGGGGGEARGRVGEKEAGGRGRVRRGHAPRREYSGQFSAFARSRGEGHSRFPRRDSDCREMDFGISGLSAVPETCHRGARQMYHDSVM